MNDLTYIAWIENWVAAQPNRFVRGKCQEAVTAMVATFPELRSAAGFAHVAWGRDQHFWAVSPNGTIIDPTVEQFNPFGVLEYEELDLQDPETERLVPTGRCMDCGEDAYGNRLFCSDDCERSFATYLNAASI